MLKRKVDIGILEDYRRELFNSGKVMLKGVIRYNPERGKLKSNKSCCIIEVDSGVADFYRYQINKEYGMNLVKPSWETHISIIQGEDAKLAEKNIFWKKHEGKEITFTYSVFPRFSGDTDNKYLGDSGWFWFVDVQCNFINIMRNELNIGDLRSPHLTVGRKK
jgi:hypothetical protein